MEDDLRWNKTFGGIKLLVEDDLRWKTTFGGRRPSVEDNFWWKTTFDGRLLVEDDPCMLPSPLCGIFLHATAHCKYQLVGLSPQELKIHQCTKCPHESVTSQEAMSDRVKYQKGGN